MLATPAAATRIANVEREIDAARSKGPLQQIVVPPCPELLTRLQRAMAVPEPDLNDVARIANADVAMAATLIRNANGALYASGPPVASAGQAMNRLGLRQTAAILTGFLARHAIPVSSPQLQRFWERSGKRALAMSFIAGQLPGFSADLAYSYGLFSHVGMPVLMQSVRGYAGTMVEGMDPHAEPRAPHGHARGRARRAHPGRGQRWPNCRPGARTRWTPLCRQVLMPGLVEGHSHLMAGTLWRYMPTAASSTHATPTAACGRAPSLDAVVAGAAAPPPQALPDGPVIGWGFDPIYFGEPPLLAARPRPRQPHAAGGRDARQRPHPQRQQRRAAALRGCCARASSTRPSRWATTACPPAS
jgi:hypothetical protein